MPKLSKVEECLICEAIPCECSGTKKPKPRPKKSSGADRPSGSVGSAKSEVAPVTSRPSMREKMKAAAAQAPPEVTSAFSAVSTTPSTRAGSTAPPQSPPDPTPDDLLAMAIRNLAPILHEEELQRYAVIVSSQATTEQRAAFWRARQGGSPDGTSQ